MASAEGVGPAVSDFRVYPIPPAFPTRMKQPVVPYVCSKGPPRRHFRPCSPLNSHSHSPLTIATLASVLVSPPPALSMSGACATRVSPTMTDFASDVTAVPASKRGRKRNDNLPPNRARDVQRAFRARRAAHLHDLESRVEILETENYRLRQMLSLPPSDRQPLGRGPTGRDPGKLMPKVGDVGMMSGSPPDHYSDRSTPSPSGSSGVSHPAWNGSVQPWPPAGGDHYLDDPVSRTSSGSSSPYPHGVNYDYSSQRLPSLAHSRDPLMIPPSGSPSFGTNPATTPRDEALLGFGSSGFASPSGVNNHPAALPPHSHSNTPMLLNSAGSNRMVPNFLNASAPSSSYLPRRSVNDLTGHSPSFPPRSASIGGGLGLNGSAYNSSAPAGRIGLSSPSPIN